MILKLAYIILTIYSFAIVMIFLYSLAQLNLLFNYIKGKKKTVERSQFDFSNPKEIPLVTIQLPLYNEKYVVERLLQNIVLLKYPADRLEIQVLDDSTDDSIIATNNWIDQYASEGIDIKHMTRTTRQGYKAGALKEGLQTAKGEFIVVFDADFLPDAEWLYKTIPYFKNEKVGVVQTRWAHTNRDFSILTKIQAFALDAHFTLEQVGRNTHQHFINFNGTAGVWRKSCIFDAGNWQADTLTEDLDLSYRAQLKKWEFVYLENVETLAELPMVISATRSQQFRWNKGGAENFRKLIGKIMNAKNIPLKTKIHGFLHLLNSSMFLFVFIVAVFSVPLLFIKNKYEQFGNVFNVMAFFITTTIIFYISYWFVYRFIHKNQRYGLLKYTQLFFTFYTIAMGFSLNNSIAVLEGLWGKKSEFVRTPKFNMEALKDKWKENKYVVTKIPKLTIVEGILVLYFVFALVSAFILNDFALFPFHLMLAIGYGYVFVQSVKKT